MRKLVKDTVYELYADPHNADHWGWQSFLRIYNQWGIDAVKEIEKRLEASPYNYVLERLWTGAVVYAGVALINSG